MPWAGLGCHISREGHRHRDQLCCVLEPRGHRAALPMKMAEQEFLNSWSPEGGQQCTGNDKAPNACKFARYDAFNNPLSEQVVKKPAGGIINLR